MWKTRLLWSTKDKSFQCSAVTTARAIGTDLQLGCGVAPPDKSLFKSVRTLVPGATAEYYLFLHSCFKLFHVHRKGGSSCRNCEMMRIGIAPEALGHLETTEKLLQAAELVFLQK